MLKDKVDKLEKSVFADKENNTIFAEFDDRFLAFQVNLYGQMDTLKTDLNGHVKMLEEKIFDTNNRISQNEVLKE